MEYSAKAAIERCAQASYAGTMNFAANVALLTATGVESYHADYRTLGTTYYMPYGSTATIPLRAPDVMIPKAFDVAALQAAIRAAQRDELKYPDFLARSMAAGCVGYIVWIGGRHVTYFGRQGEIHVEPFPS